MHLYVCERETEREVLISMTFCLEMFDSYIAFWKIVGEKTANVLDLYRCVYVKNVAYSVLMLSVKCQLCIYRTNEEC